MTAPALGAWALGDDRVRFRVWAPDATRVEAAVTDRSLALEREPSGTWVAVAGPVRPGDRYEYVLDGGRALPDPASMAQPEGVHGPSAVVEPGFSWTDAAYRPPPLPTWVLYELHVGTFTPEGTFASVIPRLEQLAAIGVNAVELMPVCEFPGTANWGYDGVFPWAAHHAYGGLDGLRRLVDACHALGIAVVLDVVYNHVGPEGSVLAEFGPYFTDRYRTPWGAAINFDGPGSDGVRDFFVESARFWACHAHVDGFRLDAVHAIADASAYPFVEEFTRAMHSCAEELGRELVVIAESADNDSRLTAPAEQGGRGFDAQWSDDFHHALHVALTGERHGYYRDFDGGVDLADAFTHGFVYRGRHSAFRGRRHGRPEPPVALERLVVYGQNHDQVGNRRQGDRLITLAGFEPAKTALACTLLAPSVPLLFMGEERAARSPFPYFVSHTDPALVEAVRRGRAAEFPEGDGVPPDPQACATRDSAVLRDDTGNPEAAAARALCRDLISLRRSLPALALTPGSAPGASWDPDSRTIVVARGDGEHEVLLMVCLGGASEPLAFPDGDWDVVCDTASRAYLGPGRSADPADRPVGPSARVLVPRT